MFVVIIMIDDDSNDVWKVMTDKPSLDSASSIQNSNNVENSKQLNAENDRSNVLIERETTN